jgi:hypothetical protein
MFVAGMKVKCIHPCSICGIERGKIYTVDSAKDRVGIEGHIYLEGFRSGHPEDRFIPANKQIEFDF